MSAKWVKSPVGGSFLLERAGEKCHSFHLQRDGSPMRLQADASVLMVPPNKMKKKL